MLHGKPLDQITESDLDALIQDHEREGRMLDYKRELYGQKDQDKLELCADVTSFANTIGGHIILGMDEIGGVPTAKDGLAAIDADKEILRMQQILRSGTQPKLSSATMHPVQLANGNVCIIIRIQRSWARPHAVVKDDWLRWHARHSNGKYRLDVPEIKNALLLSETTAERMRAFRIDRLATIEAGDTPVPLPDKPRIVYHCVPADAFDPGATVDLSLITAPNFQTSQLFNFAPYWKFNIDGILFYENADGESMQRNGYVLIYDTGLIETVIAREVPTYTSARFKVLGFNLESKIIEDVNQLRTGISRMGASLPVFVFLSIIGLKGYSVFASRWGIETFDPSSVDRDLLLFPEISLDDESASTEQLLKPVFDKLWRASGWRGSRSYNVDGLWDKDQRESAWNYQP